MAGRFVGLVRLVSRQPQVFGRVAIKPMAAAPSLIVRHFGHDQSHLQTKPEVSRSCVIWKFNERS